MASPTHRVEAAALAAPLAWAFGAVACGVAVADALAMSPLVAALSTVGGLLLLAAAHRRGRGSFVAAVLCFFWVGGLAAALAPAPQDPRGPCGGSASLWRARVDGPTTRPLAQGSLETRQTRLELLSELCHDTWQPARGHVAARLLDNGTLARDDAVELRMRVMPIEARRNPTEPEPLVLAKRDGIDGHAQALSPYAVTEHGRGLLSIMDRARERVAVHFEERLGTSRAALAKALALGDQSAITPEARQQWADAGIAHLLSVSGLHVTLVAALAYWLIYQLLASLALIAERWSVRRMAALATVPVVLGFCVWVGAPAPAVRATVMAVALYGGLALRSPHAVINSLGLAGAGILLASPASLYDPGFLLSFTGVLVLFCLPAAAAPRRGWLARLARAAGALLAASVAATIATAPITAHFFGRVSLVAPLANLIAVPLGSAIATPLALAHALLAPLARPLDQLVGYPLDLSLRGLELIASGAAALPYAAVDVAGPTLAQGMSYFVALASLLLLQGRRRWWLAGTASLLFVVLVAAHAILPAGRGRLTLLHPYVGQGDATVAQLPQGGVVLVDAGGPLTPEAADPGARVVVPLLRQMGIRHIDLAVVTHAHPDHLGGFAAVASHFAIHELWCNDVDSDNAALRTLALQVQAQGGVVACGARVPTTSTREGVRIQVFQSPATGAASADAEENDASLVLRLTYGERSVLLAGDIEATAEARLAPLLAASEILKVPHHGSRTSTSPLLLDAVRPKLAVISLGAHNHFGFPAPEVLDRLAASGAAVLRTDEDGMVTLSTDGGAWRVETLRRGGVELDR
jgi:competence protein ComEC